MTQTAVKTKTQEKQAVENPNKKESFYSRVIKRIFDVVFSTIGIILAAIPMLVFAIVIKIDSPGPVFFKQNRIGKNKTIFKIIKFRSMPVDVPHDTPTHQFKAEDMLSKWQKFIRKSSIDELPQLFCIWKGEMSIVGPRPALWNQYDLIALRDQYGANDIRPGLTGWAQVNGRDELATEEKARLDGVYTNKMKSGSLEAFGMDVKCFFVSITAVFKSKGVVEGGTGAMSSEEKE